MTDWTKSLPAWSRTIAPSYQPSYAGLKAAALAFERLSPELRRAQVQDFSRQFCFPTFNLDKASGLYLLLRVSFDLPAQWPRDKARCFGGWEHPSIGQPGPFNMAWPVRIDASTGVMTIDRFDGYMGKGYDAISEYDYFLSNFQLRPGAVLEKLN